MERGVCPTAAVCTLILKCFRSRPWPFKVAWR